MFPNEIDSPDQKNKNLFNRFVILGDFTGI